jgi:hypothetical protein
MEQFYTDRSNGGLCDGFLSTALKVKEKGLHTKFGVNQTYSDQVMLGQANFVRKLTKGNNSKS